MRDQEQQLVTDEILDFVMSQKTITSRRLQIQFILGYNHADRIINELLEFDVISEPVVNFGPHIVNKFS